MCVIKPFTINTYIFLKKKQSIFERTYNDHLRTYYIVNRYKITLQYKTNPFRSYFRHIFKKLFNSRKLRHEVITAPPKKIVNAPRINSSNIPFTRTRVNIFLSRATKATSFLYPIPTTKYIQKKKEKKQKKTTRCTRVAVKNRGKEKEKIKKMKEVGGERKKEEETKAQARQLVNAFLRAFR